MLIWKYKAVKEKMPYNDYFLFGTIMARIENLRIDNDFDLW